MANSLNQAFIQAFKKSSPQVPVQVATQNQPEESAQLTNQDLVVRLDTATMSIPQPHFQQAAVRAQKSAAAESASSHALATETSEEIRDSIADEMLRASGLGEESELGQESAFGDNSFDTFTTLQPASQPMPAQPTKAAAIEAATTPSEPVETQKPTPKGAIFDPQPFLVPQPSKVMSQEKDATTPTEAAPQQTPKPASSKEQIAAPALEPPAEPALSPTDVERIVESYVRKHGKPGDIVRVDTPALEPTSLQPAASESIPTKQNDFMLEEDLEPASEQGEINAREVESPSPTVPDNASAEVIEAEENLRRAKMRSFTPVWEVDQLHWPLVCESLIAECQDSLMNVAINLSKASEEGLQVLAVTSPEAGNGRSTVTCCLAQIAGASGLRVAIVDGDIENPSLSYQTNLDVDQDWKTAILTEMPLEEVAVHSIEDQVTLIPLLEPIHDFEMDEHDNRIAFMLQQLSESFDLVLGGYGTHGFEANVGWRNGRTRDHQRSASRCRSAKDDSTKDRSLHPKNSTNGHYVSRNH